MIRATGGLTQESHEVFADADLYARAVACYDQAVRKERAAHDAIEDYELRYWYWRQCAARVTTLRALVCRCHLPFDRAVTRESAEIALRWAEEDD